MSHSIQQRTESTAGQNWAGGFTHLILVGRLSLLHHVFVGEGGDGRRVSGWLRAAGTIDLRQNKFLQACSQREKKRVLELVEQSHGPSCKAIHSHLDPTCTGVPVF